ncbi:MAG: hypothetical protein K6F86_11455 [Lachnospiraceae bacterium]|nr:hypothetical protein [Lachnospiraceae bacterium]
MIDTPTIILMCMLIILILMFAGVTIRIDNADRRMDRLQETILKKQLEKAAEEELSDISTE